MLVGPGAIQELRLKHLKDTSLRQAMAVVVAVTGVAVPAAVSVPAAVVVTTTVVVIAAGVVVAAVAM